MIQQSINKTKSILCLIINRINNKSNSNKNHIFLKKKQKKKSFCGLVICSVLDSNFVDVMFLDFESKSFVFLLVLSCRVLHQSVYLLQKIWCTCIYIVLIYIYICEYIFIHIKSILSSEGVMIIQEYFVRDISCILQVGDFEDCRRITVIHFFEK